MLSLDLGPPLAVGKSMLLDSLNRTAVVIVFGGPDMLLEPVNCVRRSRCSASAEIL